MPDQTPNFVVRPDHKDVPNTLYHADSSALMQTFPMVFNRYITLTGSYDSGYNHNQQNDEPQVAPCPKKGAQGKSNRL